MKLTLTQKMLLLDLEKAEAGLVEATKDYWKNIKLPESCSAVPTVRAVGAREKKAAQGLVEAGMLFPLSSCSYAKPWREKG